MKQTKSKSDQLVSSLSLVPWNVLDQLKPEQRQALDSAGVTRKLARGDYIFRTGENAAGVFFLMSGKVKVTQMTSSGKEVILWFCFGGDIFGLAESMQFGTREVNAQVCAETEILCITQNRFNIFLFEHPQVMFLLLQVMTSRLRCLSETLANVAGEQVNKRFSRLLFWLCTRYGRSVGAGMVMDVQLTHQEIADMIGSTRQTVTSLMNEFKREGMMEIRDHVIHIIDKQKLCNFLH